MSVTAGARPAPSPRPPLAGLVAASAGGAIGALARWLLTLAAPTPTGHFPTTVLLVNVVGAGLLAAVPLVPAARHRPWVAVFLGTGVLGGFTTMSTASTDTLVLLDGGHPGLAAAYCLGTLGGALLAVLAVRRLVTAADDARARDEGGDP
ncbi:CrcB protein [Nocardioides scoriae]|uniref:Fluoride-specific ion channel FluC n=1 Tax=Nocardioides scoriae TaxID=642780 RepID=A0A1H1WSV2_9ACTN|nr:CrcB family protein [Nocardioides scoriae]SDT00125.1 CrcB protein [Nocardioides scoriae]